MPRTLDERAGRLLELMREADDEAVTLDELAIAGVEDPATALLTLELAGFGLERVIVTSERGRELPCVRLARPTWPIEGPAPPAPPASAAPPAPAAPPPRAQEDRRPAAETLRTPLLLALLTLSLALAWWLVRRAP